MKSTTRIFALSAGLAAVLVALVLYGIPGFAVHEGPNPPQVLDRLKPVDGAPAAPDVSFTDIEGKTVALKDLKGRILVVNLWATWCGPCITELPALARLNAALPQDRITVVPIDLEKQDQAKIADFLKSHGAGALPTYVDANFSVLTGFVANALPLTVVIDRTGREIARADGPQKWDDPAVADYLKALAAK
jgi:thiol-disulfide isomerase/thioredoxin